MRFIKSVHREFPSFLPDFVRPGSSATETKTFPTELSPQSASGGNPDSNRAEHGSDASRPNPTPDLS